MAAQKRPCHAAGQRTLPTRPQRVNPSRAVFRPVADARRSEPGGPPPGFHRPVDGPAQMARKGAGRYIGAAIADDRI